MFNRKFQPMKHQDVAFNLSKDRTSFAYLCEMGTGKTKMFLDDCANLAWQAKINACIVIAPKGVYRNWPNIEIPKHFTDSIPHEVVLWDSKNKTKDYVKQLENYLNPTTKFKFFVINIEALSSSKRAGEYLMKFIKAHTCIVTIDEATTIKHRDSKRTKKVMDLRKHAPYRRIMTGSPITNSPLDLYSQFEFLGTGILGFRSYYAFRSYVAKLEDVNLGVRTFKKVVGYHEEALHDIQAKIQPHSYRITKEECLDLPPKIYQVRDIDMSEEQERAYKEMKKLLMVTFQNEYGDNIPIAMVTTALTKLMKLHQIACGFVIDQQGQPHDIPGANNRLDNLLEVLDETDHAIIWANYRYNITQIYEAICREYGPECVAHYYGETSDEDRQRAVHGFQDGSIKYFIGNPATAGFGITLTKGSNCIYYSNGYNIEQRQQSEDRAHRIGQTKSVLYTDFIARNTIDEEITKSLANKVKLQDLVLKNGWRNLLDA